MTKKLMFDTLSYAKKLENSGVSHPDVFAEALSDALTQNINTKEEVEKMLADAMKHFENAIRESNDAIKQSNDAIKESNHNSDKRFEKLVHEIEKIDLKIAKEIAKAGNKTIARLSAAIGIPVALLTIFVLMSTLGVHFGSVEMPGAIV